MKYRSSILLSISLHVLLLLCLIKITWPDSTKTGWKNTVIIHSYIYAARQADNTESKAKQFKQKNNHPSIAIKSRENAGFRHSTEKSVEYKKKQSISTNLNQGKNNPLLIALHNAIAEKEIYPDNAQELDEQGKVALHFLLHSSGNITDITIAKSSGFSLLDNAAISALKSITPFTTVKESKKVALTIWIRFTR